MTTSGIIGAQNVGLDLTIEGATVQFANDDYKGVTHSKKLTYNVIIDQATADNVTGFDKSTVWNVKRNVKPVTVTVAGAVAYNQ